MADITNLNNFLTDVANSIRNKKRTEESIPAKNFDAEISGIPTGNVVEKVVAEASEVVEEATDVKVTSAPIGEQIVIPENGVAEVLTDKALLAQNIGLTADKIMRGNTILNIEGTAEGGTTDITTLPDYITCLNIANEILDEYAELDYITISNSFITNFAPTSNTRLVLDFKDEDTTITAWQNIIATSNGTSDTIKFLIQRQGSESRYNVYFGRTGYDYEKRFSMKNNTRHFIDYNKNNLYLDGTLVATMTYWDWTCEDGYYIALNINNASAYSSAFTIYSFKIYDNEVLIRDYVPVRNNSTTEIGLLDKVENEFYVTGGIGGVL